MDHYRELWDLLFLELLQANKSAMARMLGVSIPTVGRYDPTTGDGPSNKQWWWNIVIENIILELCHEMKNSPRKRYRNRAKRVIQALADNRRTRRMAERITTEAEDHSAATRYLLALIADAPGQTMRVKDIAKAANSGAFHMRTLRGAAERLCLIKEKRKDEWSWRLPDLDDCD